MPKTDGRRYDQQCVQVQVNAVLLQQPIDPEQAENGADEHQHCRIGGKKKEYSQHYLEFPRVPEMTLAAVEKRGDATPFPRSWPTEGGIRCPCQGLPARIGG